MSFEFRNHLDGKERAGCFTLSAFMMFCAIKCSVIFLLVPLVGLQCMIVTFADHTHLIL